MIQIYKTTDELLHVAAEYFIRLAGEAITKQDRFTVALSGGSSPKGLYALLASDGYRSKVEWPKVYFFFGDERYVPATDPDNNALMAATMLFDPLNISPKHIFAVDTSLSPAKAAEEYDKTIVKHFAPAAVAFDLVLLGLGDNAHTASLFPGTKVLDAKKAGVQEVFLKDQQVYRITLTAPLINQAHHISFLVFGSSKAEAVREVLQGNKNHHLYPAQLIEPENGELVWFMDEAAASYTHIA